MLLTNLLQINDRFVLRFLSIPKVLQGRWKLDEGLSKLLWSSVARLDNFGRVSGMASVRDSRSCRPIPFLVVFATASTGASSASPKDSRPVFLQPGQLWLDSLYDPHFFAFARFSRSSISFLASNLACCWPLFSAAVIRGTISSKGFSIIRIPRIFGGLWDMSSCPQSGGSLTLMAALRSRCQAFRCPEHLGHQHDMGKLKENAL